MTDDPDDLVDVLHHLKDEHHDAFVVTVALCVLLAVLWPIVLYSHPATRPATLAFLRGVSDVLRAMLSTPAALSRADPLDVLLSVTIGLTTLAVLMVSELAHRYDGGR